jgi:hypothetical protein
MKKLLLPLCAGLIYSLGTSAQSFTVNNLDFAVQHADISAIDIDGDGDKDLLISGTVPGEPETYHVQLFINDGEGSFTRAESPFLGGVFSTHAWGDINGDGNLDMIQSGFGPGSPFVALFTSNNNNTFTRVEPNPFSQIAPTVGMADLNNDGHQDMYVLGNHWNGASKIYFGDGNGGFVEGQTFEDFDWVDPLFTEVDFDNDGDIDLFVTARTDDDPWVRIAKMYVNNNGVFTVQDLNLVEKGGFASSTWGDFDGDGYLDLLLNGDGGAGENGNPSDPLPYDTYRLYRNNAGVFEEVRTFTTYNQISIGGGSRFADWDNDGDLDIILTGWNNAESRQSTAIFLNNNGVFTEHSDNASLPGVSESAIEVADLDNNGTLDLILTGFSGNNFAGPNSALNSQVSVIVMNNSTATNAAPASPTNLMVNLNDNEATFTWDASTDDTTPQASLSYNLFLKNETNDKHIVFAKSDLETGRLMQQKLGNVQLNRSWTIKGLTPGAAYTWGVQAIDNSYAGSAFATGTFTNEPTSLAKRTKTLGIDLYPNPSKGQFTITASHNELNVTIYALDGRQVWKNSVSGEVKVGLTPGMYILHASTADGTEKAVKKIVIQ